MNSEEYLKEIEKLANIAIEARNNHSMISSEFLKAWCDLQEFIENKGK